jgi:rod shape-determining protein MreC
VYRKQVRRRRAVLALLVAASLTLLSVSFGGGLRGFQDGAGTVFGPIESVASRALKPARDLVNWFDETFRARGRNRQLRAQLNDLRGRVTAGEAASRQNRELRGLLGLKRNGKVPNGFEPVTSRVIARSPTVWYSTVTIDAGSGDGVRVDDPVINGDGLVGQITAVSHGAAEVTLITDHTSAVSGMVVPDGTTGVIKAQVGNPEDLLLEFIQHNRRVPKGQTVVTAGWRSGSLASLFPYGIPIGRVSEVTIEEQQADQQVHVKPFADVREIDIVQVLTGGKRRKLPPEAPAP